MVMKDPIILICSKVRPESEAKALSILPVGTITDTCSRCGARIFVAPTGQRMKNGGANLICWECGLPLVKERGLTVLPETLAEIEERIPGGARQAEAVIRLFNAHQN